MYDYSFVSDSGYFGMAQSLYLGLFNDPQGSGSSGLSYWEGVLQYDTIAALDAFSYYANLNGSPITTSNIGAEVNNIYENLIGTSASSSAQQYWAGLWSGDGGSLSIAQIAVNVYDYMESLPSSSTAYSEYTLRMENHLLNYYDEAQALYIGLMGTNPTSSGLSYWNNALFSSSTAALNSFSNYVTYNGQTISVSNIDNEIVNIYKNLEGNTSVTASSNAVKYWASQWTGNGGTLSIGQILIDIYDAAQALPYNNQYYEYMNNSITNADVSVSYYDTISSAVNYTNPLSYSEPTSVIVPTASSGSSNNYQYSYAFASSTSQSDVFVIQESPTAISPTYSNGSYYYGTVSYYFTGDASGHNVVDVTYQASGTYLVDYLADAYNFQTLEFNYTSTNTYGPSLNLDLSQINSGFVNFVLDDTGFENSFTFNNVKDYDFFIIESAPYYLTINEAANNSTANIILYGSNIGGIGQGAGQGGLNFSGSTINIDSIGSNANIIGSNVNFTNNASLTSITLNISGSQDLTIGGYDYGYYGVIVYDGSTLNVNAASSGNVTLYAIDDNYSNAANPVGIEINASGTSSPINIYDGSQNMPDNIVLGSGAATVFTDNGNSTVTVGSGVDTIVTNAYVGSLILSGSTPTGYNGYVTTINGIGSHPYDSIMFNSTTLAFANIDSSLFVQANESAASNSSQAIATALNTINSVIGNNDDIAVWFQYGGNTYIVNNYYDYGSNMEAVKLTGTINLSNAIVSGHSIIIN